MTSTNPPLRRGAPWRGRGFLLLEVMLATTIFCLVAVALMNGLGESADSMRRSNRESQIRLGLESRLAEAQAMPLQLGLHKEDPDGSGVAYEQQWEALQPVNQNKDVLSGLYKLTVRAHWTDRTVEESDEASIDVYRPQP